MIWFKYHYIFYSIHTSPPYLLPFHHLSPISTKPPLFPVKQNLLHQKGYLFYIALKLFTFSNLNKITWIKVKNTKKRRGSFKKIEQILWERIKLMKIGGDAKAKRL